MIMFMTCPECSSGIRVQCDDDIDQVLMQCPECDVLVALDITAELAMMTEMTYV